MWCFWMFDDGFKEEMFSISAIEKRQCSQTDNPQSSASSEELALNSDWAPSRRTDQLPGQGQLT